MDHWAVMCCSMCMDTLDNSPFVSPGFAVCAAGKCVLLGVECSAGLQNVSGMPEGAEKVAHKGESKPWLQ